MKLWQRIRRAFGGKPESEGKRPWTAEPVPKKSYPAVPLVREYPDPLRGTPYEAPRSSGKTTARPLGLDAPPVRRAGPALPSGQEARLREERRRANEVDARRRAYHEDEVPPALTFSPVEMVAPEWTLDAVPEPAAPPTASTPSSWDSTPTPRAPEQSYTPPVESGGHTSHTSHDSGYTSHDSGYTSHDSGGGSE